MFTQSGATSSASNWIHFSASSLDIGFVREFFKYNTSVANGSETLCWPGMLDKPAKVGERPPKAGSSPTVDPFPRSILGSPVPEVLRWVRIDMTSSSRCSADFRCTAAFESGGERADLCSSFVRTYCLALARCRIDKVLSVYLEEDVPSLVDYSHGV